VTTPGLDIFEAAACEGIAIVPDDQEPQENFGERIKNRRTVLTN
jgi:hypothetical protein